ncbi:MAG: ROK family transcriptional regulator [Pelagimonas sp.]|uniref:ROK family transcriptional regulator n=1 Tax=Pelagimonas sp. TaxID=2073170 RepID=UPI003D6ADA9E
MLTGANSDFAKSLNRRVALESILRNGPISRTDIAEQTRLTPQTVSNIVAELMPFGIIIERNIHTGKKGKPAREFLVDYDGFASIGLHIDQHRIIGSLANGKGDVLAEVRHELSEQRPDDVKDLANTLISQLCADQSSIRQKLIGVGVAMPGLFREKRFFSGSALTMQEWDDYPVADDFSAAFGLPVFVENDGTAAAIGENLFGDARNLSSFLYFYFGLGLGGCVFVEGKPVSGANSRTGEFGHILVEPGGRSCPCGAAGCLERYVSRLAAFQAITGSSEEFTSVPMGELAAAYERKDPLIRDWLETAATYLATAVRSVTHTMDPQKVFFGGQLPHDLLAEVVVKTEAELDRVKPTRGHIPMPDLQMASGDVARGAAALPLSVLINPPQNHQHTGIGYVRPKEENSLYNLLTGA